MLCSSPSSVRLMEHSQNSSMGRKAAPFSANENPSNPEESGWTSYFEDFSKGMEQSYCSNLGGGSSLISDAASCAARKFSHQNHHIVSCSSVRNSPNLPKKLCFKKTRTKQISEDDPLEDTASSPVNSPKVCIYIIYDMIIPSLLFHHSW